MRAQLRADLREQPRIEGNEVLVSFASPPLCGHDARGTAELERHTWPPVTARHLRRGHTPGARHRRAPNRRPQHRRGSRRTADRGDPDGGGEPAEPPGLVLSQTAGGAL